MNPDKHARRLNDEERNLLAGMLQHAREESIDDLLAALVKNMNDGGMGSIAFVDRKSEGARLGPIIAEANYIDNDGIEVSIVLNADQNGNLYELDFWKVDFSPLRQYPKPEQLRFEK